MPQTAPLIQSLKHALKRHGKTYADVAATLELSEASVKRMFATNAFSLARLDATCQMLGMEISDLVEQMKSAQPRLKQLTAAQELEITQDLLLLLVTICVLNRWTVENILEYYDITEAQCVQKLVRLDKLELIELLPQNRVKLLVSPQFKWIENGPIQRFFKEKVGQEYFNVAFTKEGECLMVLNGMLSNQSNAVMHQKIDRLAQEFNDLHQADTGLDFKRRTGVTMVLAMRHWEFGLFRHLARK